MVILKHLDCDCCNKFCINFSITQKCSLIRVRLRFVDSKTSEIVRGTQQEMQLFIGPPPFPTLLMPMLLTFVCVCVYVCACSIRVLVLCMLANCHTVMAYWEPKEQSYCYW